jgi:hypothetical protein
VADFRAPLCEAYVVRERAEAFQILDYCGFQGIFGFRTRLWKILPQSKSVYICLVIKNIKSLL